MVRAIIFDWGGIFTGSPSLNQFCREYSQKNCLDYARLNAKMIELWDAARVGKIDSNLFWTELSLIAGVSVEQFQEDLHAFSGFRSTVMDFVKQYLKGKYLLAIITNHIESWFEPQIEEHALEEIFDAVITSYGIGFAKPDQRIYEAALQVLRVSPVECVFIDDLEKNLPTAKALGMKTVLYQNFSQLKKELRRLGVSWQ